MTFWGFALATFIGVILSKVIIPRLSYLGAGAYHPIFYILGGLTFVSLALTITIDTKPLNALLLIRKEIESKKSIIELQEDEIDK